VAVTPLLLVEGAGKGAEGEEIPGGAESGNHPPAGWSGQRFLPEALAGMNVAQVDLDGRQGDGREGVAQRDGGVGIGGRVYDKPPVHPCRTLHGVDEFSFGVGLKKIGVDAKFLPQGPHLPGYLFEGLPAVDFGLSRPEKIEVRPVDDQNFTARAHRSSFHRGWRR